MLNFIIQIFILIPLAGFIISFILPAKREILLSRTALITTAVNLTAIILFIALWAISGFKNLNIKEISLYHETGYEFLLDLYFDKITAVYLFVGALLTFLITVYSRYYLHRERGYKRFFNTILLFYSGYNLTVLSGNFETLFMGWEILGISSFLLIAFYRDRYLPTRNAVKVFSIYRIGDVGILLAMWASHHLWHENITFAKLSNNELVHEHLLGHSSVGLFISLMILIAAAAKSAQFPFSSWLPRAMEGPTPSSAIFYGSLSVHFGVFLLLRTHPFWENQLTMRIITAALGAVTAIIATLIARVQSSIKTQIAYASIAQIGLIFIEIAAGWENIALLHFMGNAFLRTYQLLVSPSVVSYLIKEQFYNFTPRKKTVEGNLPKRMSYTTYLLSLKEFHLDYFFNKYIFRTFKNIGNKINFITIKNIFYIIIPLYLLGIFLIFNKQNIPFHLELYFPIAFSFIALLFVLKSFAERQSPIFSWLLIVLNHFWIALALSFNDEFNLQHSLVYLSGVILFGTIGIISLRKLQKTEGVHFSLNQYYGHIYEHPKFGIFFFISCLGLMGFPISATFIGEDLLFSHIRENQILLALFNALAFIISGISIIRLYARLFMGPHVKTYHATPLKTT